MSVKTIPTFIHNNDWDDTSRQHPAMAFMERYTNKFDEGLAAMEAELDVWHDDNFTYVASNGQTVQGIKPAFEALKQTYGPLEKYHHEPYYLNCYAAPGGKEGDYEMIGLAKVYVDIPGEKGGEGPKDLTGKQWEASLPGGFKFYYRRVGDGFKLAKTEIFSDSGPVVSLLLKKGVVTAKDLGLA